MIVSVISVGRSAASPRVKNRLKSSPNVTRSRLGFRGGEFPEAGEYRFQLYAEQSILCERKFHISLVEDYEEMT